MGRMRIELLRMGDIVFGSVVFFKGKDGNSDAQQQRVNLVRQVCGLKHLEDGRREAVGDEVGVDTLRSRHRYWDRAFVCENAVVGLAVAVQARVGHAVADGGTKVPCEDDHENPRTTHEQP